MKRIIAMPGDWLSLSDPLNTVKIPQGHCWVEGDNSSSSVDSRSIGPVCDSLFNFNALTFVWLEERYGFESCQTYTSFWLRLS